MKEKEIPYQFTEKEEILYWLKNYMTGCVTPECYEDWYSKAEVDNYFNEQVGGCDNITYLPSDSWKFVETKRAYQGEVDMDVWGQELEEEALNSLKGCMKDGNLYIVSFENENGKTLDIMMWE